VVHLQTHFPYIFDKIDNLLSELIILFIYKIYFLYKNLQSGFHDIVQGSNGAYSARQGFDLVTGWGTPSGYTLTRLIKKN
jgi:hypothetical protein